MLRAKATSQKNDVHKRAWVIMYWHYRQYNICRYIHISQNNSIAQSFPKTFACVGEVTRICHNLHLQIGEIIVQRESKRERNRNIIRCHIFLSCFPISVCKQMEAFFLKMKQDFFEEKVHQLFVKKENGFFLMFYYKILHVGILKFLQ